MPNKGFEFGDRIFEMFQHLATTEVMLMGPHQIFEQNAMGVPTKMEEFYNVYKDIHPAHIATDHNANRGVQVGLQVAAGFYRRQWRQQRLDQPTLEAWGPDQERFTNSSWTD